MKTRSVCPECYRVIPATIVERDGQVWLEKECPEHGKFEEIYFEDTDMFKRFSRFRYTWGKLDTFETQPETGCPWDCGLCPAHLSHTDLLNIVLTNRCDLRCWYCFFYAKEGMPIYEPSLDQIKEMLESGRRETVPTIAVQFTGGEPTLRKDLPEIIKLAKDLGYEHVQLNTNGIRLSQDPELMKKIVEAGCGTLYLSFDGVTPQTNPKNHWEIPFLLENARKVGGVGMVLVPTVIRNTNLHEVGDIVRFALNNMDVVRGVDFQPVSLVGKMPKKEREKHRVTIPGVINALEDQTNAAIARSDWYPIPTGAIIGDFIHEMTGHQYWLSAHFACGAATYVFADKGKVIPISRFLDVEGLTEFLGEEAQALREGKSKALVKAKLMVGMRRFVDLGKLPSKLDVVKLIYNAFIKANYQALGEFHKRTLFLGMMHFQDPWNYDIERVKRCVVHYAVPDGRIIPFCAFNVYPEEYRDKIQEKYSIPWDEWKRLHPGYSTQQELYVRDKEKIKKMENSEEYRKAYKDLGTFW